MQWQRSETGDAVMLSDLVLRLFGPGLVLYVDAGYTRLALAVLQRTPTQIPMDCHSFECTEARHAISIL